MKKLRLFFVLVLAFMLFVVGCGTKENGIVTTKSIVSENDVLSTTSKEEGTETDRITPEEEEKMEKERQESLIIYADMINEIQTAIPDMRVNYIISNDDGGKDMSVDMTLLNSKDATYQKMAELMVTKETLMNNNGITDISIYVMNNDECVGIVIFTNHNGSYDPVVNTL